MKKILIMDDDAEFIEILKERLNSNGFAVESREDCAHCVEEVKAVQPDIVFLDIDFGNDKKRFGVEALKALRKHWPKEELPIFMLSGTGDAGILAQTRKIGATEYCFKPIEDFSELIRKINARIKITGNDSSLPASIAKEPELVLGGTSQIIMKINQEIINAAQDNKDMLFQGETGTGKEVAARLYHEYSARKKKAMVVVNCPSIPAELFESEVFGYNKGAFGNASQDHPGLVEKADGGIIFFDEIRYLPLNHQTKMLRFIQFKTFKRLGSTEERKSDAVILAATSLTLEELKASGKFLMELFYRFDRMVKINIPPLRERPEDIGYLARYFLQMYNHKNIQGIDQEVLDVFRHMKWEGNIRQLENCLLKSISKCQGDVLKLKDVAEFLLDANDQNGKLDAEPQWLDMTHDDFTAYEEKMVADGRRKFYGLHLCANKNITQTAKKLKMSKEYLRQIIKKYNIEFDFDDKEE